ncbi:MAG: hypothetical protein GY710_06165 [Desulfobacteraceae bacterium]|nr:hypothetical protein [Desulfobacteraceae bacterium]
MRWFYEEHKNKVWFITFLITVISFSCIFFNYYLEMRDKRIVNKVRIDNIESGNVAYRVEHEQKMVRYITKHDNVMNKFSNQLQSSMIKMSVLNAKLDSLEKVLSMVHKNKCPGEDDCWDKEEYADEGS